MRYRPYIKTYRIRLIFTLICAAILCLLFSTHPAYASTSPDLSTDNCTAEISRIEVAQGVGTSLREAPVNGWNTLPSLPDSWDKRWPDFHGTAWYRINWNYKCSTPVHDPVTLVIERINMAGKILINGEFIWKDLSLHEPMSRSLHMPRYWILPASSLKQGENILLIEVTGIATQRNGLGKIHLGEYASVFPVYQNYLLEKRTLLNLNAMINLVIAICCLVIWLFIPREKAFFWFAFTALLWVCYTFMVLYPDPLWSLKSTDIDKFQIFIFTCYVVCGCIAAFRFAQKRYSAVEAILISYCMITAIWLLFVPDTYLPTTLTGIFGLSVLIFILKCATYPFIVYKSGLKEAYFLAFLFLTFIPVAVNDSIFMITLEGQALSPYIAPGSSLFIGFLLALRLSTNSRRIEKFNKTLEENVCKAREELSASLTSQHALALENAKLQERIQLARDLHDGLGGSIVRSMVMLDHKQNVDKEQMMSVLKLLRNDLRQVVDSGSSIGTRIPENPVIWAAPVRHRFVQIFETMNVHSTWKLDRQWQSLPTAMQCLTFSRVAEEALTNIVKHSEATEVVVSLVEENGLLVLCIQDNGKGFDPVNVPEALHVGLSSMKVRVRRLNGHLEVTSEPGNTCIRATVPVQNEAAQETQL